MSGETTVTARRTAFRAAVIILTGLFFVTQFAVEPADAGFYRSERTMARYINRAREIRGIKKMRLSDNLSRRARRHSTRMRNNGTIWHSNLRKTFRGVTYRVIGENVGMGNHLRRLHLAFMKSPGHRANILYRRYKAFGVGIRRGNGYYYVTVIFKG